VGELERMWGVEGVKGVKGVWGVRGSVRIWRGVLGSARELLGSSFGVRYSDS